MSSPDENVPPFIEQPLPPQEKPKSDDRGTMSLWTMIFGLAAITLAILGGVIFIYDIFQDGLFNDVDSAWVKVIPVALAYGVGWVMCLISMRSFNNLVLPLIVKYYSWITLAGVLILYIKIMQKLFGQDYDLAHFFAYNVILIAALGALLGMHLLLDELDLRRYSIPIMVASIMHLALMLLRYLILGGNDAMYLFGDLYFFLVMFGLAVLMLAHLGVLNPIRNRIDFYFQPVDNKNLAV